MATLADVMSRFSELNAEVDSLRTKFESFSATIDFAGTFTDSHHAIIGVSELDNALELALLSKMHRLNRELKDRIFDGYGPLNTFAAKIDIAYALEIIPKEFYESLRKINKVRVKFAHSKFFLNFQDPEISAIIDSLPNLDLTIEDRKGRYLKKLGQLKTHLGRLTASQPSDQTINSEPQS
jgi:hypothetical protein